MKYYGTLLAMGDTKGVSADNVDKNAEQFKHIHSAGIKPPREIKVRAQPQVIQTKTKTDTKEELQDLMKLYYQTKINEFQASGKLQPAFQPSP